MKKARQKKRKVWKLPRNFRSNFHKEWVKICERQRAAPYLRVEICIGRIGRELTPAEDAWRSSIEKILNQAYAELFAKGILPQSLP